MSGIKSITKRILSDAEHKVAEIEVAAQQQCDNIKIKSDEKIVALQAEIDASAEKSGKLHEEQLLRNVRRESKNRITRAKRALIDECFDEALQYLANLPASEYDKIVESILLKMDISDAVVEQVGQNAGFIVRQGKITTNYTFAEIVKVIKPQLELEIARILWGVRL